MTLDLTKPVQTKDGRPARIIAKDIKSLWPIVAVVTGEGGKEQALSYTENGRFYTPTISSSYDLVNVPQKKYVNVYWSSKRGAYILMPKGYSTLEDAKANVHKHCQIVEFEE